MLLTQSWVNAVSIAVVAVSLWRLWHSAHARRAADHAAEKQPVSSVDAYLLREHTRANRAEIERSDVCGCIYCEQLYRPAEIAGWAGETAVCPRCGRKTVVGSGAGITLTHELLHRSHAVGAQESMDGRAS
jgi:hypothetical protein